MIMTNDEIRKEMEKLRKQGIHPIDLEKFDNLTYPAIGVVVETMVPESATIQPFDFNIEVLNKRGVGLIVSNFGIEHLNNQKIFSFLVSMRLPEGISHSIQEFPMVTSFSDFCWFHGNEKLDTKHTPETSTEVDRAYNYGDLGWVIPCRFADRLIDTLGMLNDFLLEGVLENALIYGVHLNEAAVKERSKQ